MLPSLTGLTLGKYRIIERLGKGENAEVYKAMHPALDLAVTIKVPVPGNPEARERLRRESVTLAQFTHPGIRQIRSIETSGDYFFAVLDYSERSLRGMLSERLDRGGVFSRAEIVRWLRPVADVLDYLHRRGWVHLDIKPENILIAEDGRVTVADFGIAQRFGKAQNQGTPGYASPEAWNHDAAGPPADIFSLAVIVYEMLAGRRAFVGDTAAVAWQTQNRDPEMLDRVNPRCSNSRAYVVRAAMAKDPRQRFPRSAGAFLDRLERADTFTVLLPSLPRRRPALVYSLGGLCVAGALVLGVTHPWSHWPPGQSPPTAPPPAPTVQLKPAGAPGPTVTLAPATQPVVVATTRAPAPVALEPTFTLEPTGTLAPPDTPAPSDTPASAPAPAGPACSNPEWVQGAVITEPRAGAVLQRGPIAVLGTADLANSTEYELYVHDPAQGPDDFSWRANSAAKVKDGLLWTWEAGELAPGRYELRLRVKLNTGNYKDCVVPVTLE
jgi:hypothetical protein